MACSTPQQQLWVTVRPADGQDVLGFAARTESYRPGLQPAVGEDFTADQGARDRQGRVISGIAFYGWTEGSSVRVVLLVRVPVEGAANRFYSSTADLRLQTLATYALKAGESRTLDDMKTVGLEPMSIRLETRVR